MSRAQPQLIRKFFRDHIEVIAITLMLAVGLRFFVVGAYRVPNSAMIPTLRAGDFVFGFRLPFGLRIPILGTRIQTEHLPGRGQLIIFQIRDESLESYTLLERVIGLPGDRVEVRRGKVILNGVPLTYQPQASDAGLVLTKGATLAQEDIDGHLHAVILPPEQSASLQLIEKLKAEKKIEQQKKESAKKLRLAKDSDEEARQDDSGKKTKSSGQAAHAGGDDQDPIVVPPHSLYVLSDDRSISDDSRQFGVILGSDVEAQAFLIWLSLEWKSAGLPQVRWSRVVKPLN